MKILVLSDLEAPYIWDHFNPQRFSDIDLIISCGDLKAEYLSFVVTMIKAPLFYVHGNHDHDYLINPPDGCICIDDKLILYNGIRIMGLGGTQNYNNGPFQYSEFQMSKRIMKLYPKLLINKGLDILVSHAPAYGLDDGSDLCHRGFKCFVKLMNKYSPSYFIHGHQHLNYHNRQRDSVYNNTTIINAYGYFIFEF